MISLNNVTDLEKINIYDRTHERNKQTKYMSFKDKRSKVFVEAIINKKPKYILTFGFINQEPKLYNLKDCAGNLKYYKNSIGTLEARNPFNRGNKYNGFIYEFKLAEFPNCMKELE